MGIDKIIYYKYLVELDKLKNGWSNKDVSRKMKVLYKWIVESGNYSTLYGWVRTIRGKYSVATKIARLKEGWRI